MSKIVKHGLEITASLDSKSKAQMKAALQDIFSDGAKIDLDTPENLKGLKAFARMFQDMFTQAGNKNFDFTKIMKLPGAEMFDELKLAAKEFENVWDSLVSKMGKNGLRNVFMRDQSELSVALNRLTNSEGNINKKFASKAENAFKTVKSRDINRLLENIRGEKEDFIQASTWEEQSVAALKYLNIYKRIMDMTDGDIGIAKEKGMRVDLKDVFKDLDNIGTYTVQQIESAKPQIQASLQNLFNLKGGKPLVGLTDGGAIDINVAPKLIKTLDVGDILGGKTTIEIPIDFKLNLDKLRDLYAKSFDSAEADEQFNKLQEEMVKGLPADQQEAAMERLLKFADPESLKKVTDRSYNAVWKDMIKHGLPTGTGDTGTGGEVKEHQGAADAINAQAQAQERLNNAETQNPQMGGDIQQEIKSYEELCQVLERLNTLRAKDPSKLSPSESDEMNAILTRLNNTKGESLPGKGPEDLLKWASMLQGSSPVDTNEMAQYLGVEIPQAAQKAENAIEDLNNALKETSGASSDGHEKELLDKIEATEKRNKELEETLTKIKADSDGKKLVDKNAPDDDSEIKALREQLEAESKARMEAQEQTEKLKQQLAKTKTSKKAKKVDDTDTTKLESAQFEKVQQAVEAVTTAVNQKNKAFHNEGEIVGQVVGKEVNTLSHLETQVKGVNEQLDKLFGTLKNVKTNAKTDVKVKVDNTEKASTKTKSKTSTEETPKRSKADMNQLEKDYQNLGKMVARLDDDNFLIQSAEIENLEAAIKRKQESLGLTEKEIAALKEKEMVAQKAEENIIRAEKEQAAKDKEVADNAKFASDVEKLSKQYEKLGKLQAEADAKAPGKAEEAKQLATIIQQETERLGLYDKQNAKILEGLKLKQQEAQASKAAVLADKQRIKDEDALWKAQVKTARGNTGVNVANSAITAGNKTVTNVIGDTSITKEMEAKARQLQEAVKALANARDKANRAINNGLEADSDGLARQAKQVQELTEEMNKLMAIHKKYADADDIDVDIDSFKNLDLDEYRRQLTAVAEAQTNGKLRNASFNAETKELIGTVKTGANSFTTYSFAIDKVSGKMKQLNQGTKNTETFFEGVGRKFKELTQYALSSISIYDVWNQLRNGVQYIREIDTALTELKKVTNETEASYDSFLNKASQTSTKIGSTISDYTRATATFAKLGYNMEMASSMAESAIVYQNVGDGIESAEAAAESIISTMKGFGLEASNTMAIVDSFNEVGELIAQTI